MSAPHLSVSHILAAMLICVPLLSGCTKDSPLRTYVRDELEPYLDSLTYQLCQVKAGAAPEAPGRLVCPGPPEGYKKSPGNGDP